MAKVMFGAGCFWGVEHMFRQVEGVNEAFSGYSGGSVDHPTYEAVCTGKTGHAEVVEVDYDPERVRFEQLLNVFWEGHDPTTLNRQGPDVGTQYRSAIFYTTAEQKDAAEQSRDAQQASGTYARPIVTEIAPAGPFWKAEEYHQRYFEKNGLRGCHF